MCKLIDPIDLDMRMHKHRCVLFEHQKISGTFQMLMNEYCLSASFDERYFKQSLIFQLVLFFMFVYLFYYIIKMEIKLTQIIILLSLFLSHFQ